MKLIRTEFKKEGIFGVLRDENDLHVAYTLEHAYLQEDGSYKPKVAVGTYRCVRGPHRLKGMDHNFETFELEDVPNHTNILIHWGNYNKDSDGCILVGKEKTSSMITSSRATFKKFMELCEGKDDFSISVT